MRRRKVSCCQRQHLLLQASTVTSYRESQTQLQLHMTPYHLSRGARDRGLGLCGRRSPRAACASDGALRVRCGFRLPRRPSGADSPPSTDPACSLSELTAEELSAAAAAAAVAAASASSLACSRAGRHRLPVKELPRVQPRQRPAAYDPILQKGHGMHAGMQSLHAVVTITNCDHVQHSVRACDGSFGIITSAARRV